MRRNVRSSCPRDAFAERPGLGDCERATLTAATGSFHANRTFAGDEVNDVIWSEVADPL